MQTNPPRRHAEDRRPETRWSGRSTRSRSAPSRTAATASPVPTEGQVLFVRHTLPGEKVIARVTDGEEDARFLRADAVTILERVQGPRRGALPVRRPRPLRRLRLAARQAGRPAPAQGRGHRRAAPAARRASPPRRPAGTARSCRPRATSCPPGEVPAWRTRVQYAVDEDGRAGLRKHRSHEVEPIEHCMIAAPGRQRTRHREARLARHGLGRGDRRHRLPATARSSSTPKPGARLPLVELDKPVSVLRVDEHDGGIHRVHGRAFVRERADGRTYRVGSGGFWQVHPQAADTLVKAVMQGLMPAQGRDGPRPLLRRRPLRRRHRRAPRREGRGPRHRVRQARGRGRPPQPRRTSTASASSRARSSQILPAHRHHRVDLIVLDPPRAGAGKQTVEAPRRPRRPPHRLRRLRPGGARPRPGVLPRRRATRCGRCGRSTCSR